MIATKIQNNHLVQAEDFPIEIKTLVSRLHRRYARVLTKCGLVLSDSQILLHLINFLFYEKNNISVII